MEVYRDPVCGMEIADPAAAPKCEYKGDLYFFCSLTDKNEFDKDPEKYIRLVKQKS